MVAATAENQDSTHRPNASGQNGFGPPVLDFCTLIQSAWCSESYFQRRDFPWAGKQIAITVDASPWGLDGVFTENDQAFEFFSDRITDGDLAIHSI